MQTSVKWTDWEIEHSGIDKDNTKIMYPVCSLRAWNTRKLLQCRGKKMHVFVDSM